MPTWTESLSIGVPAIDSQHKELFAWADALLTAMCEGRAAPECTRLFLFLRNYCKVHFGSEERLMREMWYPGTQGHLVQHADFSRRFEAIAKEVREKGASSMLVIELQNLICSWLVRHIGEQDTLLAEFLGDRRQEVTFRGSVRRPV
jgi:hemerythrin